MKNAHFQTWHVLAYETPKHLTMTTRTSFEKLVPRLQLHQKTS